MSMVRCDECELMIDSDDDCDCFIEPPVLGKSVLCTWCRKPEETPEAKVGQALRAMFAAMDELIALANTEETRTLVCNERIALGQILSRCETLCSYAMAVKSAKTWFRRVS